MTTYDDFDDLRGRFNRSAAQALSLFDAEAGTVARDAAIEQVEENADDRWKRQAIDMIRNCAHHFATFTTDDVWYALHDHGVPMPREGRAMGAMMRKAEKAGVVAPMDDWTLSKRPECHRRPLRKWRSLIHRDAA